MNKESNGIKEFIPILLFLTASFCFFGPLSIYLPNSEELSFGLKDVLINIVPFSIIFFVILFLLFFIIPKKYKKLFIVLIFSIAFILYIQGNYLSLFFKAGVLDGTSIDWESYRKTAIINFAICIFFFVLILLFYDNNKKSIYYFSIISLFLIAIQIPALIAQLINYNPKTEQSIIISKNNEFEFSEDENVVFIILDAMDEDYYSDYLKSHNDITDKLNGFVHYDNAMTAGAKTIIALPIFFTGQPFLKEETYTKYLERIYKSDNVITEAYNAGYDTKIFSERLYFSNDVSNYVSNFETTNKTLGLNFALIKKIYKLTLYRYLPIVFKPFFFFNTAEFEEISKTPNIYSVDDATFYKDLNKNKINTTNKKCFITYHLNGAHSPYRLGSDGNKSSNATQQTQVEGVFTIVVSLLDNMKKQNVYDNSTIIITADHGENNLSQHPILLIKEKDSKNNYSTSSKPISSFDLPVYFCKLFGSDKMPNNIYGIDIQTIDENTLRTRHLFYNSTNSSNIVIKEYTTDSNSADVKSLKLSKTYEDVLNGDTPYKLGDKLSFEADATGNIYCTEGFSTNTGFRTMLRGPISSMSIPFEKKPSNDIDVHIDLHLKSVQGFKLVVKANNKEVYSNVVDKSIIKNGIGFTIPKDCFGNDKKLNLDFVFPDIDEKEMELSCGKRTETISFVSLIFE